MNNKVLRLPEVIRKTGLSRSWLYEHIKMGEFPKQIKLGIRAVGWHEEQIDPWIAQRPLS